MDPPSHSTPADPRFVAVMNEKFDVAATVHDTGDALFDLIDDNDSGEFGKEELGRVFMNNGVYLDQRELDELFDEIDSIDGEGDGMIDHDECPGPPGAVKQP
jgi:Ca2+-binding EF-hand superfamily protein